MLRFRQMRCLQKFAAVHSSVHNHFSQERHLHSRDKFKLNRAAALAEWRSLGAAQEAVLLSKLSLVRIGLLVWTAPPERHRIVPCWCCEKANNGEEPST